MRLLFTATVCTVHILCVFGSFFSLTRLRGAEGFRCTPCMCLLACGRRRPDLNLLAGVSCGRADLAVLCCLICFLFLCKKMCGCVGKALFVS